MVTSCISWPDLWPAAHKYRPEKHAEFVAWTPELSAELRPTYTKIWDRHISDPAPWWEVIQLAGCRRFNSSLNGFPPPCQTMCICVKQALS